MMKIMLNLTAIIEIDDVVATLAGLLESSYSKRIVASANPENPRCVSY